jgi:hypothetical protein
MDEQGLAAVEAGMRFARLRATVLADDLANARTPGFVARDAEQTVRGTQEPGPDASMGGTRTFGAVLREVGARGVAGVVEYAMGAQTRNAVVYRALADEEHAMLRELRTVAEEARRS